MTPLRDRSITFKLFTITLGFLLLFISLVLVLQLMFFEEFYIYEKTNTLTTNVLKLKTDLNNLNNNDDFIKTVYKFEENNNAQAAFLNSNGFINFIRHPYEKNDSNNFDTIYKAIDYWLNSDFLHYSVLMLNKTVQFTFKDPTTNIDSLVIVSPLDNNAKISEFIFAVSPLQPVGEATSIIKKYFKFVFIGTLLIILLLSFINSKMISKPLINLNEAAKKMINLDFSSKCEVDSKDEIGNLALTFNFLSDKLNSTLTDLKMANVKLTEDIEKERLLEKMRKEFIADVSHELKTPISIIEGYAEALKDGIVEENDVDYYTDVIIDEAKKMNSLVMDMLTLSHMESKSYALNKTPEDFISLIKNIYKKYKVTITTHNIEFSNLCTSENVSIDCDAFKIEEVMNNLITNAIKYTPSGELIKITLSDLPNNHILVEVDNFGSHIPEKDIRFIWDKFYRIDKSRNKDSGGTGLGLAITKNILELHESNYGVKNTEDGVKFYFSLTKL